MSSSNSSRRTVFTVLFALSVAVPATALATHTFADVSDENVHAPGIEWVAESGVTAGCGDGTTYCPEDPVTRAQMATFMHRLSGNADGVEPSVAAASSRSADSLNGMNQEELFDLVSAAAPRAFYHFEDDDWDIDGTETVVRQITFRPTFDGTVIAGSSAWVTESTAGEGISCWISDDPEDNSDSKQIWYSPGSPGDSIQLSGQRAFEVTGEVEVSVYLVCRHLGTRCRDDTNDRCLADRQLLPGPRVDRRHSVAAQLRADR